MKLKTILTGSAFILSVTASQTFAGLIEYTYNDNPANDPFIGFPSYSGTMGDENGTPKIEEMKVFVDEDSGFLQEVTIDLEGRRDFDSLFINTNWDETESDWENWDYFVRFDDSSGLNDTLQNTHGLYEVFDDYEYTLVDEYTTIGRDGHANGFVNDGTINNSGIDQLNASFAPTLDGTILTYDFSELEIDMSGGFTIAYGPWCMNDVVGGSSSVPEPATMLLFGTGLVGLAGIRLKKSKNS